MIRGNDRRWAVVGIAAVVVIVVLALGLRWLTSPGAPVPTAPVALGPTASAGSGGSIEPSPSRSLSGLPDQQRTPGSINPAATQASIATTVCKPGWASSVRPPSAYTGALKLVQIVEYGYTDRNPSHYQEDHLVPLELGGAPRDPRNLWPEPNAATLPDGTQVGSKEKDDLENVLHAKVCSGVMPLDDARRVIAIDWIAAWGSAGRP